jgi:hypothetical protein
MWLIYLCMYIVLCLFILRLCRGSYYKISLGNLKHIIFIRNPYPLIFFISFRLRPCKGYTYEASLRINAIKNRGNLSEPNLFGNNKGNNVDTLSIVREASESYISSCAMVRQSSMRSVESNISYMLNRRCVYVYILMFIYIFIYTTLNNTL